MMSTDRTAIRRRLAIRRTAHRPPARVWKGAGHRSILAPLAATIAASVAVGVGVAIARAGRERRPDPEPEPDRSLGLLPGEGVGAGLRRMALGQVDMAIEMLEGAGSADAGKAIHETRKALKRLRALVRVLESELGRKSAAREDRALAATARLLAGARDGEVLLGDARRPRRAPPRQTRRAKERGAGAPQSRGRA